MHIAFKMLTSRDVASHTFGGRGDFFGREGAKNKFRRGRPLLSLLHRIGLSR